MRSTTQNIPRKTQDVQMHSFKQTLSHSANVDPMDITDVPPEILPNVLSLLGESVSAKAEVAYLPTYSMFYFSPISRRAFLYNIFYIFVFYLLQIQISLSIAFGPKFLSREFDNFGYDFAYWLMLSFFAFDIVLNFHKGYYAFGKGRIVEDHRKIIRNYLTGHFSVDLLCVVILIIPQIDDTFYLNLIQLIPLVLMWFKKFKYQNEVINILQYSRPSRVTFMLIVLFIDVLLIGHYGACIFVGIDLILWREQYYGSNQAYYWLSNDTSYSVNLIGGEWWVQYIYAQSFSTGTLSTMAPGPFGKNPIQIVYVIFLMTYFMLLASYVGEVLISILYTEEEKRIFHEENIQTFDRYMSLKSIPSKIKTRIYNFFELIWEVEIKVQNEEQKAVIDLLPPTLKEELLIEMSFVKSMTMLRYFGEKNRIFLEKQLASKITRVVVDSDTCLFRQAMDIEDRAQFGLDVEECRSENINYITQGMAKFYVTLKKKPLNTEFSKLESNKSGFSHSKHKLTELSFQNAAEASSEEEIVLSMSNLEKFIGLYEFVTRQSYEYCCKAVDLCEIDRISRADLMELLEVTNNCELFHQFSQEVLLGENGGLRLINKFCIICLGSDHIESKCPQTHFGLKVFQQLNNKQEGIFSHNQGRNAQFSRSKVKGKATCATSRKIYQPSEKQSPLLSSRKRKLSLFAQSQRAEQQNTGMNLFSELLNKGGMRLEDIVVQLTKIQELEECCVFQGYYPKYNIITFSAFNRATDNNEPAGIETGILFKR